MCAPLGEPRGTFPLGPGLCWETPFSAKGEVLEAKRLKTCDEKQRKLHRESLREREMDGYRRRGRKQGGEVIA